jgi:hypothetical protein
MEVAVTVTSKVASTVGAVYRPEEEIDPGLPVAALTFQVTEVLKLPVPFTVAEHWLVPPEVTVVGEQLTLTEVMVVLLDPPPPPPQAASHRTLSTASNKEILRAMMISSPSGCRWAERPAE